MLKKTALYSTSTSAAYTPTPQGTANGLVEKDVSLT